MKDCYCCGFSTDEPWYVVEIGEKTAWLCDSCSAELAHSLEVFVKGKVVSMKNEKEFQNEQREKKQVPEQLRLV